MEATRVLVVDDDYSILEVLTRLLNDYPDVEVVGQAVSGDEAMSKTHSLRPHIVIMDIRMPKSESHRA